MGCGAASSVGWGCGAPSCTAGAADCTGCAMGWGTAGLIGVAVCAKWAVASDWLDEVIESEDEAATCVGDSEVDVEVVVDMGVAVVAGTAG